MHRNKVIQIRSYYALGCLHTRKIFSLMQAKTATGKDRIMKRLTHSDLYARIRLTPMNAIERQMALNALRDADAFSDAVMWVVNGLRRLIAPAKAGGLKHSH